MGSDDDEGEWPLQLPLGWRSRLAYGPDFKHDDVLPLEMDEAIPQEALVDGCVHLDSPATTGTLATCSSPPSITAVPVVAESDERSSLHAPSRYALWLISKMVIYGYLWHNFLAHY